MRHRNICLAQARVQDWYQAQVVSFEARPLSATGGLCIKVRSAKSLGEFDTLVIPGWSVSNRHVRLDLAPQIVDFARQGKRIISFCSGVFLLAQLGLLNGKRATTHWRYEAAFIERFAQVNLINDVLYTQDSNIFCSAGSAAALDLGLEIIRQDFGHTIANQVARRLVVSPHRSGGQAQYVQSPVTKVGTGFSKTLDWAITHINHRLSVDDLANQANMSRRSFDRHFRFSLGVSPKSWLNQQRVELAKRLMEAEHMPLEHLPSKVGFDNSITLRFNFNKYVGIAPSHYQSQFSHKVTIG